MPHNKLPQALYFLQCLLILVNTPCLIICIDKELQFQKKQKLNNLHIDEMEFLIRYVLILVIKS